MENKENHRKKNSKTKKSKAKKSKIKKANGFLAIVVVILVIAIPLSIYYINQRKMKKVVEIDTIYNNIYIEDVNVGGLTKDKAKTTIEDKFNKPFSDKKLIFTYNNKQWSNSYSNFGANYNIEESIKNAYSIGREGTLKQRYDIIIGLKDNPQKISLEYNFNKSIVEEFVKKIEKEVNKEMKNSEMQKVNGKFTGTTEQTGEKLNVEETVNQALQAIENKGEEKINLIVEKILPEYTSEDYNKMNNLIGSFNTVISNSSAGKLTNIKLASSKIDSKLIYPGEVFSANGALGPTTTATGYVDAPIIVNGKLEDGIGGGVCQVSSTLYNAVMYAELEIVERQCHSRPVGYVDKGRDATLAGDYLDFKFKNSTKYPIYIESYVQENNLFTNIYGDEIHQSNRKLKFESVVTEILEPPAEQIIEDATIPIGTRIVISQPKEGYKVKVYKSIYEGDVLLEKTHISTSTYKAARGEVKVGTKKV